MKKKRKIKVTRGEKLILNISIVCGVFCLAISIFMGASIGNLNLSIEKLKFEISKQNKTNESLEMQISELTSFDEVKDIVEDMGLTYKNQNIIIIEK